MSTVWLPCGLYHQDYSKDHGWWQTPLIKGKMILLLAIIFIVFPLTLTGYWFGVANMVGYTALGALGVQILIGYAGLITLGHAAFIAVGAYTSTLLDSSISMAPIFSQLGPCLSRQYYHFRHSRWALECPFWSSIGQG